MNPGHSCISLVDIAFASDSFYTTLCNAMDYACTVFPVTFVDLEKDTPRPPHDFYNHEDEAIYKLCMLQSLFPGMISADLPPDDPQLFPGTPVGLQLIGRPQEEEAVIAMTEIVDNALNKYKGQFA